MTIERLQKFLSRVPEYLHKYYDGSAPRGYYDAEKYRQMARADLRTSETGDQDHPQC
jgi:hypothetical protein